MPLSDNWYEEMLAAEPVEMRVAIQRYALAHPEFQVPAVEPTGDTEEFSLLQIDAYCEEVGDLPAAIAEGLLRRQCLILVTAKPKSCKSFLVLQILHDVAAGVPVLGHFTGTGVRPVVYLSMEDPPTETKRRLQARHMLGVGLPFFLLQPKARLNLGVQSGVEAMHAMIQRLELSEPPAVIAVDTARVALSIANWNDPAEITRHLQPLLDYARQNDCCILVVSHDRKAAGDGGDRISGANALQSNADGYLMIAGKKQDPEGNAILDLQYESRADPAASWTARMDTDTLKISILTTEEAKQVSLDADSDTHANRIAQVRSWAESRGAFTVAALSEDLSIPHKAAYALVSEMLRDGILYKTALSVDRPGAGRPASTYALVREQPIFTEEEV